MKYYVLFVEGDVFPILNGPFRSDKKRNDEARRLKRTEGEDNGIYWMNISKKGKPVIGAYSAGFFTEEAQEEQKGDDHA